MKTGWMCPRCGVCWSPKVERCECKPQAAAPQYAYPYWYYWQPPYWQPYPRVTFGGATTVSGSTSGNYTTTTTGAARIPGLHAGQAWMSDDFDAPLGGEMGFGEG